MVRHTPSPSPFHPHFFLLLASLTCVRSVGAASSREQDLLIPLLDQQMPRLIDCAMKPLIGQRLIIYNLFRLLATRDFGVRVLQVSKTRAALLQCRFEPFSALRRFPYMAAGAGGRVHAGGSAGETQGPLCRCGFLPCSCDESCFIRLDTISPLLLPPIAMLQSCSDPRCVLHACSTFCYDTAVQVFGQIRSYARDGPYSGSAKIVAPGSAIPEIATRGA